MLNIALAKRNEINSKESGIYTFPPNFPAGTLGLGQCAYMKGKI